MSCIEIDGYGLVKTYKWLKMNKHIEEITTFFIISWYIFFIVYCVVGFSQKTGTITADVVTCRMTGMVNPRIVTPHVARIKTMCVEEFPKMAILAWVSTSRAQV